MVTVVRTNIDPTDWRAMGDSTSPAPRLDDKAVAAVWMAWHEMNAIRARDGVPWGHYGGIIGPSDVSEKYWSSVVDALQAVLGEEAQPWPSMRMRPHLPVPTEPE